MFALAGRRLTGNVQQNMSAIALFTRIRVRDFPAIRDAAVPKKRFFGGLKDNFHEVMSSRGVPVVEYPWSGYAFAVLLPYLSKRGVDLKSEHEDFSSFICKTRDCSAFVLGPSHKRFLSELADEKFDETQLQIYYEEFTERKEDGWGVAMLDGIRALRTAIETSDENTVVLLSIV